MTPSSLLILGAGTAWVYALGAAMSERGHFVHAIAPYDLPNYRRLRPVWPSGEPPARLRRDFWVMPPGYAGKLEPLFRPWLRWRVQRSMTALQRAAGGATPWLLAPYPWFNEAARVAPDERLIYYNLDDYIHYQPERAALILRQESALLKRAALTLCLSQTQVNAMCARCPAKADVIHHFPLGAVPSFLNPHPEHPPQPRTVVYAGNLIDRVDWRMVGAVARALTDTEFLFVGGMDGFGGGGRRPDWKSDRDAALSLPNVRSIGRTPQDKVHAFYWEGAVNWIPYATDHAFNQAACPTKIMDALAAGRPVVSTDVPECRLYPEWIRVVSSSEEMTATIRRQLAAAPDHVLAWRQVDFVRRDHTWSARAKQLERWLHSASGG